MAYQVVIKCGNCYGESQYEIESGTTVVAEVQGGLACSHCDCNHNAQSVLQGLVKDVE